MKISILTPDLSHNCLGRAYLLAKLLQNNYSVEIIGPMFNQTIWQPVAYDKSIQYKYVKITDKFKPYFQIRDLYKLIDGDVIYASKPILFSTGTAILVKYLKKKPLILDIDDWHVGFLYELFSSKNALSLLRWLIGSTLFLYRIDSLWNPIIFEKLTQIAEAITVSNRFLHKKFGGAIIWHARDTSFFDPSKYKKDSIKERYGIGVTKKLIMFLGTPRPYKGLEDLIDAVALVNEKDLVLFIIGIDMNNSYCKALLKKGKKMLSERFLWYDFCPFDKAPEMLSMADIIVIPQHNSPATWGQVPAKVFDAMAMAKPIIATEVSDLPEILDTCGWIVKPKNPELLSNAIQHILENKKIAESKGWIARKKCIDQYSIESVSKKLLDVFKAFS